MVKNYSFPGGGKYQKELECYGLVHAPIRPF